MQWLNSVSSTIGSLFQSAYQFWQEPEDAFFMAGLQDEGYQAYINWCTDVRQAERLLWVQLAKKQLNPEGFRKALLAPLANLPTSVVSPLYYYLRLKKLEQTLTEKGYPNVFRESAQEAGHRLREALKGEPDLIRDYFYQDLLYHLVELSAQRFTSNKLLNWMSFYEDLVETALYQPVKQALADFVRAHPIGEIAARQYKVLIAQLNRLFQETSVVENSIDDPSSATSRHLNFRFLVLAGLALTGSYAARQIGNSYSVEEGLIQAGRQSLRIMGVGFSAWSTLSQASFGYSQGYSLSLPILAGSLSMFPLAAGQIVLNNDGTLDLSSLDGSNGFVIYGEYPIGFLLGYSIASGDINADGIVDVLIGAPFDSPGGRGGAGASYVMFGHSGFFSPMLGLSSLNGTNGFAINGVNANDYSGGSIASGDINGDGVTDVLIGAYYAGPGNRTGAGASYVVFGHTGSFPAVFNLSALDGTNGFAINGVSTFDHAGCSIASEDINADGIADVLIGAYNASSNGHTSAGASYVVFGHTGSFPATLELLSLNGANGFVINGVNATYYSGGSIASGNINSDGIADVLIGASGADPSGRTNAGASYVVFGHTGSFPAAFNLSALDGTNGFAINGVNANDYSGRSIASGDINADGKADVLIGASQASPGGLVQAGASYVVFGHTGSFPATLELSTLNGASGFVINGVNASESGWSIASGDINGDGMADVLIGAPSAGASYVVFGHTGSFPAALELLTLNGANGFAINGGYDMSYNYYYSGWAIASGDINGDGTADVLMADPHATATISGNTGEGSVVFGSNITVIASPSSTPSNTPSPSRTPSNTPSISRSPSITPSITPSNSPRITSSNTSSTSAKTKIALGVSLAVLGLFAVGSGTIGYKLYQRRKAQLLDLEMRGMHLSGKERRAIGCFVLINDLDVQEAQALYEQTGLRVEIPEGEHCQKVVLGEGEFGKVKLAYDREAHEFVGVKKIKGVKAMEASEQERLVHKRLNGLSHILPLLYSEITEDSQRKPAFYQFIRLAGFGNGERLCQQLTHITDGELKRKLIQHVGQGLLTGLAGMHDKNTYHLDIKPQNYMLTIDGMVYVIDFGCTREFKSGESCWIDDGGTGDVSCFSPERLANFRYVLLSKGQAISPATEAVERYDAEKADAWSVGLALLELMIGRYPLSDDNIGFSSRLNYWDSISMGILLKTAWAAVESSGLFASQQGQALVKIVKELLTIDPAQRLTVREALKHPLFTEPAFKPAELKEQFRALNELSITGQKNNNNNTRRDGSLYSATVASRAEDPNYANSNNYSSKLSVALKA